MALTYLASAQRCSRHTVQPSLGLLPQAVQGFRGQILSGGAQVMPVGSEVHPVFLVALLLLQEFVQVDWQPYEVSHCNCLGETPPNACCLGLNQQKVKHLAQNSLTQLTPPMLGVSA